MLLQKIDQLYTSIISPDCDTYDGSQHRLEFRDCVEHLRCRMEEMETPEVWFLEIGAFKGLWALAFAVLCRECGKIPRYVTVTWMRHNPANQDILATKKHFDDSGLFFRLIDGDSADPQTVAQVTQFSPDYYFVFIDGDHSFKAVLRDIKHYAPLATELLWFHDINTRQCGVRRAIEKSRLHLNLEISYGPIMGIGIRNCRAGWGEGVRS